MSLDFSGGNTHKVTLTSDTTLDDIFTGTILMWLFPTDTTTDDDMYLVDKGGQTTWAVYGNFPFSINFVIGQSGTALVLTIPFANFAVFAQDKWLFLGVSFDAVGKVDADQIMVMGDTFTPADIPSGYTTQEGGSGTPDANGGSTMIVGNRSSNGRNVQGRIGYLHIIKDTNLSVDEMISRQFRDMAHADSVFRGIPGVNGTTTVPDWSGTGNDSTGITGTSVAEFYPYALHQPAPFYSYPAALAGGVPFPTRRALDGGMNLVHGGMQ